MSEETLHSTNPVLWIRDGKFILRFLEFSVLLGILLDQSEGLLIVIAFIAVAHLQEYFFKGRYRDAVASNTKLIQRGIKLPEEILKFLRQSIGNLVSYLARYLREQLHFRSKILLEILPYKCVWLL
jgi:hypothetical protein